MKAPLPLLALGLALAGCGDAAPPATQAHPPTAAPVPAQAANLPALTGRVVDRADLLAPDLEARLTAESAALEQRTSDQLVIVTIPSLGGRTIKEEGLTLGRRWGVGQRGKDNGVLLIVAPSERKVRIEVGYGLEPILTNSRAADIIRSDILPHFRDNDFPGGIAAGSRAIIAELIAHADVPRRGRS